MTAQQASISTDLRGSDLEPTARGAPDTRRPRTCRSDVGHAAHPNILGPRAGVKGRGSHSSPRSSRALPASSSQLAVPRTDTGGGTTTVESSTELPSSGCVAKISPVCSPSHTANSRPRRSSTSVASPTYRPTGCRVELNPGTPSLDRHLSWADSPHEGVDDSAESAEARTSERHRSSRLE